MKRTPYWLPATGFYFLVFGVAVATFFLVILIFHEGGNEVELVTAGLSASAVLIGGVVLREIILRGARERHIASRRLLDRNIQSVVSSHSGEFAVNRKFTLEQIMIAIDAMRAKSDAAKVFNRIAAGHKEVFDLCDEYRRIVAVEIPNTHPDSPRLKAMVRGRRIAAQLHEVHMLRWAEIESSEAAQKAAMSASLNEKIEYENHARGVVDFALRYYPEDQRLLESARYLESGSSRRASEIDDDSVTEIELT